MPDEPTIYLIGGSNGAGKTTFAKAFLPYEVRCLRFLNADEIARGLSPLDPSLAAFKAGRLLLNELHAAIAQQESFALESPLSGRTYVALLRAAREQGYEIELHYLWISAPQTALARVRQRVRLGGHHVPEADVRRRFHRSLQHFVEHYATLATRWTLWDNREPPPKQLANSRDHDTDLLKQLLL